MRVVVNQDDPARPLPALPGGVEVVARPNQGFNIGAWEHGWRTAPPHAGYLFVQDECTIRRAPWLQPFVAAVTGGVGLVGERLNPAWSLTWEELEARFEGHTLPDHWVDGRPAERMACYRHFFATRGIAIGMRGDHLQTLVLYVPRHVLVAIDGFPIGRDKGEAVAAEIAISKKVEAAGFEVREVGPEPFWHVAHPQWLARVEEYRRRQQRVRGSAAARQRPGAAPPPRGKSRERP